VSEIGSKADPPNVLPMSLSGALAGNQIISLSARSVRTCDVSAIGIRLDKVMYGGADVSDIRGIVGK
jgi:hypothetical protein